MGSPKPGWKKQFRQVLPELGHRNWILIADSAYPAQTGSVEVVSTGEDHIDLVSWVLKELADAAHVRPVAFLDAELSALTDELAPGVSETRQALANALAVCGSTAVLHEELIARLSATAQNFQVLVLKSTGVVPYSSVFIELDCGYWAPENEAELRLLMSAGRRKPSTKKAR